MDMGMGMRGFFSHSDWDRVFVLCSVGDLLLLDYLSVIVY